MNSTPIALLTDNPDVPRSAGQPEYPGRTTTVLFMNRTRERAGQGAKISRLFGFDKAFWCVASLVVGVFAAGCNERHPSSARFDSAVVQARVEADWDDIDAAVEVGAGQAECAIARTEVSPDGLERRFKLTHISGRRGELLARIEPGSRLDPRPITLSCSMGALTDPALERLIVRRITLRLADLKGKEFAPIRQ